jgi:hypothetical protein
MSCISVLVNSGCVLCVLVAAVKFVPNKMWCCWSGCVFHLSVSKFFYVLVSFFCTYGFVSCGEPSNKQRISSLLTLAPDISVPLIQSYGLDCSKGVLFFASKAKLWIRPF